MSFVATFLLRWAINATGLWLAAYLFGISGAAGIGQTAGVFVTAGLLLSIFNIVLKPVVTIVSLPLLLLTVGLFSLIINGLMVYFAYKLTPGVEVGFWASVGAGIVIAIVNYGLNILIKPRHANV